MNEVEETEDEAPRPKSRLKKLLRLAGGLLLLGGVGFGAALYAQNAGYIDLGLGQSAEDPNRPHLVARAEADAPGFVTDPDQVKADPRLYKASYYPIENSFTSNLRDSESFVQVGLGVSTYYDERVFANLQMHEMAVRSAVLMTLADQDPAAIESVEGKRALQGELKKAINDVLRTKEGFGGIDSVYFTGFVMQ